MNSNLKNIVNLLASSSIKRKENPPRGVPRYTINGEGFYSVTQILDDGSFKNFNSRRMMHALTLGSVVHLQIENYLKKLDLYTNIEEVLETDQFKLFNFLPIGTDEDWNHYLSGVQDPDNTLEELLLKNRVQVAFEQFLTFFEEHELDVVFAEEIIWHPKYLYAGTIDLVCRLDGDLTIIDHKTSRMVDNSINSIDRYSSQLSAYLNAFRYLEENEELDINLSILHLNPKNKKYNFIKRKYNFELFLKSLTKFSVTKIGHELNENTEKLSEKEINKMYLSKKFNCPHKKCQETSSFPFPVDNKYLLSHHVNKVIKVAYHEKEDHYVIYHISIPENKIEQSFIEKIKT